MFVSPRRAAWLTLILYLWIWNRWTWAEAKTNYCNIASCKSKPHTMCSYPTSGPSSNCYKHIAASVTKDEMSRIVKKHNELRKKVADGKETRGAPGPQPPASDMRELKWDDELAEIAQRWADQCISSHDECRNTENFAVGQNIATQWNSGPVTVTVEELIDRWYDEVEDFNKDFVAKYRFDSHDGHYTQLVWGNTSRLGCGIVRFFDRSHHMNAMRLICNYEPAGNFIDHPVYKKGKAASACPSGVSKNIASLCA